MRLGIYTGYLKTPYDTVDGFLSRNGSIGITDTYRELYKKSPADAKRIFEKYKGNYHPLIRNMIQRILKK